VVPTEQQDGELLEEGKGDLVPIEDVQEINNQRLVSMTYFHSMPSVD
jgi:hypothetical protein